MAQPYHCSTNIQRKNAVMEAPQTCIGPLHSLLTGVVPQQMPL